MEAVHNAYREGFTDAMTYEKKSPTKEAGQEGLKETNEINIQCITRMDEYRCDQ